ncbi:ABC transporter ATP-binding protein [Clostridium sp. DJ247]|uniref:ABC transporter ATP-binding protein n=1 Tax=Clostridium sp. DJ247 TaxID=2726188 RepID=UPI00162AE51A|nr:oligopeptide/dipeptide ABC transporter ATP-binding protein [Clostridium sp. DJ247]MBC2582770.1 ATP-binding cassette domain-containing protein [Clostridium sp. DJ247]
MKQNEKFIEIKNLKKYFKVGGQSILKAVDDVSFTIKKGETLGLVGESGCGKTTCGRTVMGLYPVTSGEVLFQGVNIHGLNNREKKEFTRKAQIIFQDPYASLNPRMTVGDVISEGIEIHKLYTGTEKTEIVTNLLRLVGLNKEHASRFPHEFSGGQRQRIGIARALAVEPEFIVCDEPISALDVSIQAQVVNLLIKLQKELGLTYLFIAHDLSMVKHISDRVGVMYLGKLVELASSEVLYSKPLHPYTKALLSAIPIPDPNVTKTKNRIMLEGEVSSPIDPKPGCRFANRCKYAKDICSQVDPEFKEIESEHFVACHLFK